MEVHLKSTPRARRSRLRTPRERSKLVSTCMRTMDKLIAKLPHDTALAIYRDAVLMHVWRLCSLARPSAGYQDCLRMLMTVGMLTMRLW